MFGLFLKTLFIFHKTVPTQDVTNPVSLPWFCCMNDAPFFVDTMFYFIFHTSGPTNLLNRLLGTGHQIKTFPRVHQTRQNKSSCHL